MTYNSLAELFTAIANSIRGKTGGTEKIVANDFPAAIDGISSGGGDEWYITDASYLFYNGARLDAKDALLAKLKSPVNMLGMFSECGQLTELDVSGWDTSKVTSMSNMFNKCQVLTELDVSNWNTGNVTSMTSMFMDCRALASLDVGNWNTGNVTNMSSLFANCMSLASLDVSNWDTSNVTGMSNMFNYCSKLTSPFNLSHWDTSKVTSMSNMFALCAGIPEITGFSATNKAGLGIAFPVGNSVSSRCALKRLTFRTDLPDGVYSIRSAINIKYCDFDREGMVEMFNTLPDVSGLGLSSSYTTITITGNGCLTGKRKDGSACDLLTAEDEAIATAKGWTLVK